MRGAVNRTQVCTVDGVRLAVQVRPAVPADAGSPSTAVVVAHGFGASAACERVDAVAVALHERGHTTVTYDARGHGASAGETTLGILERHDVAAAVDVALGSASRVVLVGTSMGGIAVLRHAAEASDRVTGVVTVSCPAEWKLPRNTRGVLAALTTQTGWGRRIMRSRTGVRIAPSVERGASPVEVARTLRCPVAVIHGRDDPFVAASAATLLHANAGGPSRLAVVGGLAHAFDPPEVAVPPILDAVEWVLSQ